MTLIEKPDAAARLARTIVADIALYNKEKIEDGIKNDNIFDLLSEELREGEALYKERVSPNLVDSTNYFNIAIVDILIKRYGNLESNIW